MQNTRKLLNGKNIALCCYVFMIILLACTTFVEVSKGTDFVLENIYHAWWFILLWGALVVFAVVAIVRYKIWRNFPVLMVYVSFMIILLGALVTHLTGENGYIHLREGEPSSTCMTKKSETYTLPFAMCLEKFELKHYPGTTSVSDYISNVSYQDGKRAAISMNNILATQGYRFYQSSYDQDLKGTLLTVNYDPWGTSITYFAYILLGLSMLLVLFSPKGNFRKLIHHSALKKTFVLALLISVGYIANAQPRQVITKQDADELSTKAIVYNNRVSPFNTMALEVMRKVYGKTTYKGLNAEQVVASWMIFPVEWKDERLIKIDNDALINLLNLDNEHVSLQDLYAGNTYRLQALADSLPKTSPIQKEIRKIDEKVSILVMLQKRTLFKPTAQGYDEKKIKAEIFYNKIDIVRHLFKIHLSLGLLAFGLFIYIQLRQRKIRYIKSFFAVQVIHSFVFLSILLALRWYISGHIPLSNGYETLLMITWVILFVSLMLYRKFDLVPAAALLLSGFTLLVCQINYVNPQITNLVPVLASPWLSLHVSTIMISYALLTFTFFNGFTACLLHRIAPQRTRREIIKLQTISKILLYPAVFSLASGIFIGAIWANVSWGRYWAWDPKEVWALITMLVYALPMHSRYLSKFRKPMFFHIYLLLAVAVILMTYFGVNMLLGGMHSYNNG